MLRSENNQDLQADTRQQGGAFSKDNRGFWILGNKMAKGHRRGLMDFIIATHTDYLSN